MNLVIEFAGYVLLGTVLFGVVIGLFLLRAYINQPRPVAPHPARKEPPNEAPKAARAALEHVKRHYHQSSGAQKERLDLEVRRLERRLAKLEQQIFEEQRDYQYGFKRREVAWLRWKELHDRLAFQGRRPEPETRELLRDAEQDYRALDRQVEEEWHRIVARDLVNLEELRGQHVLSEAPASEPEPEAAPGGEPGTERETPEAPPGEGQPPPEPEPAGAPGQAGADEAAPHPAAPAGTDAGLHQADFLHPAAPKAGKRYMEPSFDLSFAEDGVLRAADLSGVDFSGVHFKGLHLHQQVLFPGASLDGMVLEEQERPHQFVGCDFSDADFSGSHLTHAIFSRCDFSRSRWTAAQLERVKFVTCGMEGVSWQGVDLSRTVMSPEMIAALDFSHAAASPRNVATAQEHEPEGDPEPAPGEKPDSPEKVHGDG
jgi:hypothetical protein